MRTCIMLALLCIICSCNNRKSIEQARLLYETGKRQEAEHPDSAIVNYQSALRLLENSGEYALLEEIDNRIGDVWQEHIRLNKSIPTTDRTPPLSSAIIQQRVKQAMEKKDKESSIWVVIILFVGCILFLLYRKYFEKKIFYLQKEITTKSQDFQNELKDNQWIGNYVELKALKESEEAQITDRMVQISTDCIRNLKKDPAYPKISDLLSASTQLSVAERDLVHQVMKRSFYLYVKELSHYVPLADDDYYLCCMALAGFSTKQCALCRGVGDTAIRVRRKRIKEKMGIYFHSEKLYDSIFGKKS